MAKYTCVIPGSEFEDHPEKTTEEVVKECFQTEHGIDITPDMVLADENIIGPDSVTIVVDDGA